MNMSSLARPLQRLARTKTQITSRCYSTGIAADNVPQSEGAIRRFWKNVEIEKRDSTYAVMLDKRTLKTVGGNELLLPTSKRLVTTLVAAEWENQENVIKAHALPMTSIVSRATDDLSNQATREALCEKLLAYLDTDTVCFHEQEPEQLTVLQERHWNPLLAWIRTTFDVQIEVFDSLLYNKQPDATKEKLRTVIAEFDQWQMAAMERATYTTKSFIIALALVKRHLDAEGASLAAQVEVQSQIDKWGEVEDSHDVDFQDVRRQLGSAACVLSNV